MRLGEVNSLHCPLVSQGGMSRSKFKHGWIKWVVIEMNWPVVAVQVDLQLHADLGKHRVGGVADTSKLPAKAGAANPTAESGVNRYFLIVLTPKGTGCS